VWGGGSQVPDAANSARCNLTIERANATTIEVIAVLKAAYALMVAGHARDCWSLSLSSSAPIEVRMGIDEAT
jgi:hypothetical protein